jgi:hypothetical protein
LRLLAAAPIIFGSLVAPILTLGTTRAGVTRFDPSAREAVKIALFVWGAQLVLFTMAGLWVVKRRGGGRWNSVTRPAAQLTGPVVPNPAAPYAGWKTRVLVVREEPGSTVITLRPYRLWEAVAFPGGMLVGMLVIAPALLPESMMQAQRVVGVLILLAICLVSGAVGALVASLLGGREEVLTVSGGTLAINRERLRWPKVRTRRAYAVGRVMNLRAVQPPPMKTSDRYVRPIPRPWSLDLEFDYDGGTVRFGAGLVGPDADLVLRALTRAISPATPS